MGSLRYWLSNAWRHFQREAHIPAPPFRASKRCAVIMNGLWYGRLTPEQARRNGADMGLTVEAVERMVAEATQPPSYSSQQAGKGGSIP
jgi:hypothetical protein